MDVEARRVGIERPVSIQYFDVALAKHVARDGVSVLVRSARENRVTILARAARLGAFNRAYPYAARQYALGSLD